VGYKTLGCFEFFKSLFLIFENNVQIFNILLLFLELILKIEKSDLENLKHPTFLYLKRFQYEEFNESDKSKFKYHLIYFLS
jgi:hypothetical protein